MARRARLDAELVRRNLARSRGEARELVDAGAVFVDGQRAAKVASQIDPAQALEVRHEGPTWVSRGAHKLIGALDRLGDRAPQIEGVRALDAGASTGGFTQVLLSRGAAQVIAVDVGYGQLAWQLQQDPRVQVVDRTNVRTLTPEQIRALDADGLELPPPTLVVADLSFISLTMVLDALAACAADGAAYLLMVKPQFEVGKERLGAGGVVRDPALHIETVETVCAAAAARGLGTWAVAASPLPGPAGNVEYFVALSRSHPDTLDEEARAAAIARAVAEGPAGGNT